LEVTKKKKGMRGKERQIKEREGGEDRESERERGKKEKEIKSTFLLSLKSLPDQASAKEVDG